MDNLSKSRIIVPLLSPFLVGGELKTEETNLTQIYTISQK